MSRRLVVAALLLTVPGLFVPGGLANPDDADAAWFGCRSDQKKVDKVRKWEWNTPAFKDPDQGVMYVDSEVHNVRFKLIADLRYALCPRGDRVDLLQPKSFRFCYGKVKGWQNTFQLFDGWRMNPQGSDSVRVFNPPPKKIPEEGGANCVTQSIPLADRKWLRRDQEPGYEVRATLNIHLKADESWMMCNSQYTPWRYLKPASDPNAAGGYWYTGTGRTVVKRLDLS